MVAGRGWQWSHLMQPFADIPVPRMYGVELTTVGSCRKLNVDWYSCRLVGLRFRRGP